VKDWSQRIDLEAWSNANPIGHVLPRVRLAFDSRRILMYSEASFQQVKTKEVMGHHLSQARFPLSLS
jgi:hypothetical protein